MNQSSRSLLFSCLLALLSAPLLAGAPATDANPLGYSAADPKAPAVAQKNLVASERFWPYRVILKRAWQPPGREKPIAAGEAGVLIRIDAKSGLARIDFGGLGVYEVPVDRTDLIESANRIRLGQLGKQAPNFVFAVGPRLLDPTTDPPRAIQPEAVIDRPGFLCVFADPSAENFADLARALAPLTGRHGVATVFFPQGRIPDKKVWERLRSLGWPVPFVYEHLSVGYTDSLLPPQTPMPALLLQTPDGRVLLQSGWSPQGEATLREKIDESFKGPDVPLGEPQAATPKDAATPKADAGSAR